MLYVHCTFYMYNLQCFFSYQQLATTTNVPDSAPFVTHPKTTFQIEWHCDAILDGMHTETAFNLLFAQNRHIRSSQSCCRQWYLNNRNSFLYYLYPMYAHATFTIGCLRTVHDDLISAGSPTIPSSSSSSPSPAPCEVKKQWFSVEQPAGGLLDSLFTEQQFFQL